MKEFSSQILEDAVTAFASLPGIGRKSAFRMALHLLRQEKEQNSRFIEALRALSEDIQYCNCCHNISDKPICDICADPLRDHSTICVVESIKEVMLIENTGQYRGVYHVLGGLISPMNGISPTNLQIASLIERISLENVSEVILALSPNIEGETTSFYIFRKLKDFPIRITALAQGISVGDDLEYADEVTLGRALINRQTIQ